MLLMAIPQSLFNKQEMNNVRKVMAIVDDGLKFQLFFR